MSIVAASAEVPAPTMSGEEPDADAGVTATPDDFDELFAAHYTRLVRALSVISGSPETAADAVQEAFVKAHLRWRRVAELDDPVGWIRRVAINDLRDEYRRSRRQNSLLARLGVRTETIVDPPEVDEVDQLLAGLPRQQRAVAALFYVDGLTIAEIADALEIAEGSVKSHLHDARRRLRTVLGPTPGGATPSQGGS